MFKLRLTPHAGKGFKGLTLEISRKGFNRAYITVQGLIAPDFSRWDSKQQCFTGLGDDVAHNNNVLKSLLDAMQFLLDAGTFTAPKDLTAAYKTGLKIECKKSVTLLELVDRVAADEKNKTAGRSANYQLYQNLSRKLSATDAPKYKGEKLADCDVTKLTNAHFAAFGSWVLDELEGQGYKNLMISFSAVLNKYGRKRYGLDIPALSHDWRAFMPKKKYTGLTAAEKETATAAAIPALSVKDIKRFAAFDLSKIAPKQQRNAFLLEVYRDFALLMYHTTARPADVLQWDYVHNYNPETGRVSYVPHKLRNRGGKCVTIDLNDEAKKIIEKYNGMSKGGYLLPLPINETAWGDDIDGEIFSRWEVKRNNTLEHTNSNLQKIATALGITTRVTLYTFRHSAITHACKRKGANVFEIARNAGTSVAMIQKHYFNSVV